MLLTVGAEPNRGPPSASATGCLQDHASVVHQSEEDEGHLPHAQPLQHWCHPEVSDCRGVVSRLGPGLHPVCPAQRDGKFLFFSFLLYAHFTQPKPDRIEGPTEVCRQVDFVFKYIILKTNKKCNHLFFSDKIFFITADWPRVFIHQM